MPDRVADEVGQGRYLVALVYFMGFLLLSAGGLIWYVLTHWRRPESAAPGEVGGRAAGPPVPPTDKIRAAVRDETRALEARIHAAEQQVAGLRADVGEIHATARELGDKGATAISAVGPALDRLGTRMLRRLTEIERRLGVGPGGDDDAKPGPRRG